MTAGLEYDVPTWDRMEQLLARAVALPPDRRREFLQELMQDDPDFAGELTNLLSVTAPSNRFFRKLEKTLYQNEKGEDTGAVLATFDPRIGQTVSDRYELEAVLGRGGMGTVYRAKDLQTGDVVALKALSTRLSADRAGRKRFFREARTAARVRHPNVCPVIHADEAEDGTPYLVMPFYEGTTLSRRLREGPMSLDEANDWLAQAGAGLAAIHRARIVHRDLSPANLFRTSDDTVVILDFGLAKLSNVTMGTKSRELGTLPYMAPEQLTDDRVDRRADVWAMAAIYYEMVSGERPFPGGSISEIHDSILDVDPKPLHEIRDGVSSEISETVAAALTKAPRDRLSSVARLAEAVL